MLSKIWNEFTWHSKFDDKARFYKEYWLRPILDIELEEKLAFWKLNGKKLKKTPQEAIEEAVWSYCNKDLRKLESYPFSSSELKNRARALAQVFETKLVDGIWLHGFERIGDFWYDNLPDDFLTEDLRKRRNLPKIPPHSHL